jgi:hypothetical protein
VRGSIRSSKQASSQNTYPLSLRPALLTLPICRSTTPTVGPKADVAAGLFSSNWLKKELEKVTGGGGSPSSGGSGGGLSTDGASSEAVSPPALVLAVQPGDGGPLEDWYYFSPSPLTRTRSSAQSLQLHL